MCQRSVEPFVGSTYDHSSYLLAYFTPSKERWNEQNDGNVLCVLCYFNGATKKGSAQNSFG